MIKAKPSDAFKMVLSFDPALDEDGAGAMQQYLKDRDLSHFSVDYERGVHKKTGELVSVITAYPLRSNQFHLIELGSAGFRQIVKTHVVKAINLADHDIIVAKDGEISEKVLDDFDGATMAEIAQIIIEKGKGADGVQRAFFSEGTSSLERIRSHALRAMSVKIENANDTQRTSPSGSEMIQDSAE
jgi:hypothetical protein